MLLKHISIIFLFIMPFNSFAQASKPVFEEGKKKFDEQNFYGAIEIFESLVEKHPENADFHYWLGSSNIEALQEASLFEKASLAYYGLSHLKQAISIDSSNVKARVRLANYYFQAPAIVGGSYSKALSQAVALREYDKTLAYSLEASIYTHRKEHDKAEQLYLDLIERNENNYKVYYRLSDISLAQKDYEKAIAYCQKSIEVYPEYLMGYYQYGKVAALGNMNYKEEAIRNLQYYISAELESNLAGKHWAYLRLGQLYEKQAKIKEAKAAYQNALKIKADFKEAKNAITSLN